MAEKTCGDCIHAEICEKSVVLPAFHKGNPAYCRGFKDIADFEPVRHGRWDDKPNPQWKAYDIRYCSVCGWSIHKSKLRNADLKWSYCPNCGAKMDKENP